MDDAMKRESISNKKASPPRQLTVEHLQQDTLCTQTSPNMGSVHSTHCCKCLHSKLATLAR